MTMQDTDTVTPIDLDEAVEAVKEAAAGRTDQHTIVTNTPRPGETPEQIAARSRPRDLPKANPGVTSIGLATVQVASLVNSSTAAISADITRLRDELDDAIRNYEAHAQSILDLVARHQTTGESFTAVKDIAADAIREVQERLREEGAAIRKLVNNSHGG